MSKRIRRIKYKKLNRLKWSDIIVCKDLDEVDNICVGYYKKPIKTINGTILHVRIFMITKDLGENYNSITAYNPCDKKNWTDNINMYSLCRLNKEYFNHYLRKKKYTIFLNTDLKLGSIIKPDYLKYGWD